VQIGQLKLDSYLFCDLYRHFSGFKALKLGQMYQAGPFAVGAKKDLRVRHFEIYPSLNHFQLLQ
jgi:hypothetical protein